MEYGLYGRIGVSLVALCLLDSDETTFFSAMAASITLRQLGFYLEVDFKVKNFLEQAEWVFSNALDIPAPLNGKMHLVAKFANEWLFLYAHSNIDLGCQISCAMIRGDEKCQLIDVPIVKLSDETSTVL